mgnify:CR=1 FL=1
MNAVRWMCAIALLVVSVSLSAAAAQDTLVFGLEWDAGVDLALAVSTPGDDLLTAITPTTPDGGALDSSQGNGGCAGPAGSYAETASWKAAPPGDYVLLVMLSDACGSPAPAWTFRLQVLVNGALVAEYRDSVRPGDDGSWAHVFRFAGGAAHVSLADGAVALPGDEAAAPLVGALGTLLGAGQDAPGGDLPPAAEPDAPPTGPLIVELTWPASPAFDLDLMVTDPLGILISYERPLSASGGELENAQGNNYCTPVSAAPREVITWAEPLAGDYEISVAFSLVCGGTLGVIVPSSQQAEFTLRILGADGQVLQAYERQPLTAENWTTTYTR